MGELNSAKLGLYAKLSVLTESTTHVFILLASTVCIFAINRKIAILYIGGDSNEAIIRVAASTQLYFFSRVNQGSF